jgi:hypothetical protein
MHTDDYAKKLNTAPKSHHVITLYGECILSERDIWLVQESIEGVPLCDLLATPLDLNERITVALQVTKAIECICVGDFFPYAIFNTRYFLVDGKRAVLNKCPYFPNVGHLHRDHIAHLSLGVLLVEIVTGELFDEEVEVMYDKVVRGILKPPHILESYPHVNIFDHKHTNKLNKISRLLLLW